MKQLVCEMCGSNDLIKQDGVFVCQYCGAKYSVEEARKMMVEGTVEVQGTVKIDVSDELKNLYQIARRAKDDNNGENASKYYDMILVKDPNSWEASFYLIYCRAMECKIAEIQSAGISVANCIDSVLKLIKDHVQNPEEQRAAYSEVANRVRHIAGVLYNAALDHYEELDAQIQHEYVQEWVNNSFASIDCVYTLGNSIDVYFSEDAEANAISIAAWKQGIMWHESLFDILVDKKSNRTMVEGYINKVKKYDASYTETFAPSLSLSNGCYVATCVYGSYDCPQVWTLRRFRDETLGATWYGRAFIRTYYAISPTLVKWFGKTTWFKRMWKGTLNKMVSSLNNKGVADTPYQDKDWR